MSFSGLILTNLGKNELIRAEMGNTFNITHIVLGDGVYTGAYTSIKNVINPVIEIPVTHIYRDGEEVYVECDFDSTAMPESFYLREIGIIANGVLCYYDNAREDAEFIDPASETLVKQKRMRFVLLISSELTVNVDIKSSLYALATDLQDVQRSMDEHMGDVANPHQVTKEQIGLGNVDNTADMEKPISTAAQTALDLYYEQLTAYTDKAVADLVDGAPETMNTLKEVADALAENEDVTEALNAAIGTKANQAELDTHTGNTSIHVTPAEKNRWNNSLESDGNSVNNTVTFTSGDSISPTAWTDVALLKSGEKHSTIFNKVSTMFKNIRYLYKMLGNTDISAIGDGTATGAISELNTNLSALNDITIIGLSPWDRNYLQDAYQYTFRLNAKQKQCNVCGTMTFSNVPIGGVLFTVPPSIMAIHGAFLIGHSLSGNMCIIKIPAANETDQIAVAYGMQIVADTYFFNDIYFTA